MSYIATQVHSILIKLFPAKPFKQVFCEHYVNYKGQKLFFDFYIKKLDVFIEVQGRQHTEYVKHFHQDREAFLAQKARDNLKIVWAEENDYCLVRINFDEEVTDELIMNKITKAMEGGFYE
jgi:very-short-patch-repair endonuclease